jgi:hypothetical protein
MTRRIREEDRKEEWKDRMIHGKNNIMARKLK